MCRHFTEVPEVAIHRGEIIRCGYVHLPTLFVSGAVCDSYVAEGNVSMRFVDD